MSEIGQRIRAKRLERGLSQKTLAGLLRVDRTSVGNWERGNTRPKGLHLWMLEQLLGCKFAGGDGNADR